jgi:alanyl-tRNA synthetase
VITEESGIAKGIRRIVAVTGHEAHDVTRLAQSLGEKLDILEVSTGKTKDSGLKAFSVVRPIHSPSARTILDLHLAFRNSAKLIFPF